MIKIGIDIDDTVLDTIDIIIKESLYYDKEYVLNKGYKDESKYEFTERLYWDSNIKKGFFEYFRKNKKYLEAYPKGDAVYYLNKLHNEGNEIYFISRRKKDENLDVLELTKNDLKKKGFKFTDCIINTSKKGNTCQELGIDLFIDDSVEQIEDVSLYNIKTILIDTWYNKDYKGLKFSRYQDIYNYVREVFKNE